MKPVFCTIDVLQPATQSLVLRNWANSALCALIGMVAGVINREKKALAQRDDSNPNAEATGITTYSDMRDQAQDDNNADTPIGGDTKLTLNLLVEWAAAVRAQAFTVAEGFEGTERRFAQPQDVEGSLDFMATPRTRVTQDQIDAVREEEPEISAEDAVKLIQSMAIEDAAQLGANKPLIAARVNELLNDAPSDREMDTIFSDLPEQYQETLKAKAVDAISKELARTLKLAIKGVPGISAKRKILKADMPALEELAA